MAQLTIYIDDQTLSKVEKSANLANMSVSKWVRDKLYAVVEKEWPRGYFRLFGSLSDFDIERPEQTFLERDRDPL